MVGQNEKRDYRSTAFLIGLSVLMAVCLGWLVVGSMLGPRLFVSDVELGAYTPGQLAERAIHLENRGSTKLLIHDVKTCCGISLVGDLPKAIAAGSTDVIVLHLRAPNGLAPLEKYVTLHTNDPGEPVRKVFVRGTPDSPVYAPSSVDLQHIVAGEKVGKTVEFLVADKNKQVTFSVVASTPNIHTSSPLAVPAKRLNNTEYDVFAMDVCVDKETPRGPLHEYIYVKTGLSRRPYLVIRVMGSVERGLRAQPQQAFFGLVKDESIVNRIIRLEVIGPGWDSINVRPPDCPSIAAKLQQKSEKKFELHVFLDPARMPDKLKSKLTLQNSSGDIIQIPVLAMRKTL